MYRQNLLPSRYRNGVFIADWTFGRVLFVPLKRSGTPQTPGSSLVAGAPESVLVAASAKALHHPTCKSVQTVRSMWQSEDGERAAPCFASDQQTHRE